MYNYIFTYSVYVCIHEKYVYMENIHIHIHSKDAVLNRHVECACARAYEYIYV